MADIYDVLQAVRMDDNLAQANLILVLTTSSIHHQVCRYQIFIQTDIITNICYKDILNIILLTVQNAEKIVQFSRGVAGVENMVGFGW